MDLLSQEDKAKMFAETNSRVEPFSVQKIDLHRCAAAGQVDWSTGRVFDVNTNGHEWQQGRVL